MTMPEFSAQSSPFDVMVEATSRHGATWRVTMTMNGYQWTTLQVPFADFERATRVADFLREELRPEAEREWREINA